MQVIASEEEIRAGRVTDVYFERTRQILAAEDIHRRVKAEFVVKSFPGGTNWGVLAGLAEAAELLVELPVQADALPEGTIFGPHQPVLVIEGDYVEFAVYETALLGFLCQASGIATKAARCRLAAEDRLLVHFGARRMHPSLAPMIDYYAYIGGCDGVAVIAGAERLGIPPMGTMPHALMLVLGDTVEAALAFHRLIDPQVPRVVLIDTFHDETFAAVEVAETLGRDLAAVRLDTPSNRRGNFRQLLEEVRWELDLRGYQHVKLFVSGGIDEDTMRELNPVADGYGVGTAISNAPVLDFSLDIVEVEGRPLAKRGKPSGAKAVWRKRGTAQTVVRPAAWGPPEKEGDWENLLQPLVRAGRIVRDLPSPQELRQYVLEQLPLYSNSPPRRGI
ncbi:MAG TPA: nicotinate phosphoribosyltransferase [Armatimonadetes bacterium]|nr:nicotinate phosphoribosyltransferase [Armatimonadota bacterium]